MCAKKFERLPKNIKPSHYDVFIKANFDTFKFTGRVVIDVNVLEATKLVKMNCAEIEIDSVFIGGEKQSYELDTESEELSLQLEKELPVGAASITIKYSGIHGDKMKGFYRTKHTKENGDSYYSLVTQFESTDARRALPCWDEPSCKATFDVSLNVPTGKTALSNMNETGENELGDGTTTYSFARTPIMSSYLLAFAVGEYEFVESKTNNGVIVRVYTDKGCSGQGKFALETGVKSLEYYEDYFNIKYPLPKCDMIAVPDFQVGAMENWGLVTYRATCILFDAEKSPVATKQRVAIVVCHELAHQWFGNLVTMEWWTHLWLNEGFASFMEYLCTDALYPEWKIWDQFVAHDMCGAMKLDGLNSSHPIEVEVGHPSEVDEIFDQISYSKGCSVLRMLHNWIGDANFRKGLEIYLNKYAYSNALTEQLWAELSDASSLPVERVMKDWTSRMGFPMVSADVVSWQGDKLEVKLTQTKFSKTAGLVECKPWSIPITILTSNGNEEKFIFDTHDITRSFDVNKDNGWIKLNLKFMNWHQVKYDEHLLNAITKNLSSLETLDRLSISFELNTLASAGVVSMVQYLKVLEGYTNEDEYCIWSDICLSLDVLERIAQDLGCESEFNKYIIRILEPPCVKLCNKVAGEDASKSLLRGLLLSRLSRAGHQKTIDFGMQEMNKLLDNPAYKIDVDLVEMVYRTYAQHGENAFEKLKSLHSQAMMAEEKNRIERSISRVSSFEDFKKCVEFCLSCDVRDQDKAYGLISAARAGKMQREYVLTMTFDKIDYFESIFGGMTIGRYLNCVTSQFQSNEMYDQIVSYFEKHPIKQAERSINQGLETIKANASLVERDGDAIKTFLSQQ